MEPKMNISTQIKKYRNSMGLSQEELAEKIFVSRQTVSNWENNKNYPDIHSLLLLGSLFNVSLDNLIKGDIEIMKKEIEVRETEVKKFNKYAAIFGFLLIASVVLAVPLAKWLGFYAIIPWGIIYLVALFFAIKIEKIKKAYDIHTWKEIVAFDEGKRLDEITKAQEKAKRPYQAVLLVIGSALVAFMVCFLLEWIISHIA